MTDVMSNEAAKGDRTMTKTKKILLVALVLLLAVGGFWLYWEQDLLLSNYLPQQDRYEVSLIGVVFEGHEIYEVDASSAEQIVNCLNNAAADRGPSFDSYNGESFSITVFYKEDPRPMAVILLIDDGRILLQSSIDDIGHYFEGGEDLYQQIKAIAEKLPVEE